MTNSWSMSSGSSRPCSGCSISQRAPASTGTAIWIEVALYCGPRSSRASSMESWEPYQSAPFLPDRQIVGQRDRLAMGDEEAGHRPADGGPGANLGHAARLIEVDRAF